MDSHLMFKIVHMTFASLAIIVFVIRAVLLFWKTPAGSPDAVAGSAPKSAGRIVLVAMQHLAFTLLIITGLILLYQNNFVVQLWFYGKVILFLVILSAVTKAFGKRDIGRGQRKAGVMVAGIAFAGLMTLVVWKPHFSDRTANAVGQSASQMQTVPAQATQQ